MYVGMCVCVCGTYAGPHPGRMKPGIQSRLCLLTWGGKRGLLLDSLGMSWGCHGALGTQTTGTLDCGLPIAPQKHGRDWLDPRAAGGAVTPGTSPVSWPSADTAFVGSPSPGTKSWGSLGAWRSQVNRKGTAEGDSRTGVSVYLFPYSPLPTSQQGQLTHYSGDLGLPTWPAHAGPHPALWDGHHHCRDLRWAPTWVWLLHESFRLMPFPHLKSSMWQVH